LGYGNKLKYGLPELKKYRIIFFSRSRFYLNCIGYYIDFEPRLWNAINIAAGVKYQRVVFSIDIPADGKFHKVKLPTPPDDED